MNNQTQTKKTWCSIDLDAIAHNYRLIRQSTNARIISVVKAGGYGHGAVPVAKTLEGEGCDFFAVSSIEEALELRAGGVNASILILGYVLPDRIEEAVDNGISFACASYDFAKALCSRTFSKKAKIHIKLGTGMNRTGFNVCHMGGCDELCEALALIKQNSEIHVEGVFSHLAKAESDAAFTQKQFGYFENALSLIEKCGITPEIRHICNSQGAYLYPSMHLDAIRAGVHLYGCEGDERFLQSMDFCTRIVDIHKLYEGDGVSYGLDFIADRPMKIAIIGAGYADGIFRCLSCGKGYVLIRGKRCKIIGRVCMDMTAVDISGLSEAHVGDIVTIWGKELTLEEQAKNAGTISYELMCSVSPRVERVQISRAQGAR